MHLNAPVGPHTDFYNWLSPCSNRKDTPLQRWEEEAAAKLTCYSSCHLHRRKMSALLIEICVFYKWHNRCCALVKTIQTVMLQKLFRQKRGCHVLNISHTHRHSNDFGNVWLCPKLSCLKHSLGFSFPDGETIALSSSYHIQDDIFLSETAPHQKAVLSTGYEPSTWGGNGNHSLLLQRQQPRVESSQDLPINPCALLFTLENWYWYKYVLPGWGYPGGRMGVRTTTGISIQVIFWIMSTIYALWAFLEASKTITNLN